jgi:ankyrin repeat protein
LLLRPLQRLCEEFDSTSLVYLKQKRKKSKIKQKTSSSSSRLEFSESRTPLFDTLYLCSESMTWTTLHDAVQHHDVQQVLQRAKTHPEEAVSLDDHRSTPLLLACWEAHPSLAIVQALIQAHPQAALEQNTHGDTPLHVLLSNPAAPLDCVKALVDASPSVVFMTNKEGLMPLHMLCRYDPANHDVLELLLEAYPKALKTPIKVR